MKKIIILILITISIFTGCNQSKNNVDNTDMAMPTEDIKEEETIPEDKLNTGVLIDEDNIVTIGDLGLKFSVPLQFTKISREEVLKALEEGNEKSNTEMTDEEKEIFLNSTFTFVDSKNGDNLKLTLDNSSDNISLDNLSNILITSSDNMSIAELESKDIIIENIPARIIRFKDLDNNSSLYHSYIILTDKNSAFIVSFLTQDKIDMSNVETYFSKNTN